MMAFLITLAFIALILLCGFMVLVILMQKASQGAGLGGAVGGGAAESAFGGEASNVLTKVTIYCSILFFIGCLGLSLVILHRHSNPEKPALLEEIKAIETAPAAKETTAPAAETPAVEAPAAATEEPAATEAPAAAPEVQATAEEAAAVASETPAAEEAAEAVTQ